MSERRVLDLAPQQWWMSGGERLRVREPRLVPLYDEDGTVDWVAEGERELPGGGEEPVRALIRADALPDWARTEVPLVRPDAASR